MSEVFTQISLIILVVLGVSFIMRLLKQPLIVGYIISGVITGPFFLGILPDLESIKIFSDLGIAFLLFIVGLHLSPKVIKEVGKISLITGIGQIIFTSLVGYFLAIMFGFPPVTALYIAIALTFSSTIIIMKLLSDKGDLKSLYGKISIGFLIVQDLVAIFILIIVSSLSSEGSIIAQIGLTLFKGLVLVAVLTSISIFILPKFQNFFGKSQEFLFIFAIAWGLGIASLFFYAGLSIEVGALIAGVLLSVSPYNYEISSKLKSLRDFFIISFFLILGAQMAIGNIGQYIIPAIVFSLFVLIGNPLIVMTLMGAEGFTKKTGFLAGLTVAQISEFSFILIALGVKVGHLSNEILSFVTLIGLITIAGSSYMITYSNKIYSKVSKYLSIFERKEIKERKIIKGDLDAVLFGYNRIGFGVLSSLKRIKRKYLVVDFNPDVISDLKKLGIPAMYGDVDDEALLKELPLEQLEIAISTIPEFETNALLVKVLKSANEKTIVILRAHSIEDALDLYKLGADYVLTPHFLGGEYLSKMLIEEKTNKETYAKEKEKHIDMLKERLKLGQRHPEVEKD